MIINPDFQLLQAEVMTDPEGYIRLEQSEPAQRYRVLINASGQILLDPITHVPEQERWLWQHPQALAAVQTGLAQVPQGDVRSLGSFAQYVDLDIED